MTARGLTPAPSTGGDLPARSAYRPRTCSARAWAWTPRSGRFHWGRWIGEHKTLAHQSAGLQREPGALLECRQQLFRPSHALLRIVAQRHPENHGRVPGPDGRLRTGGLRISGIGHLDRLDERAQVIGHRRFALPAFARERRCPAQGLRGHPDGIRIHAWTQEGPVDGGEDTSGKRRLAQPHALHVHQRVARRQDAGERLAYAPAWQPLDQPDINELALAGDGCGQRSGRGEPWASAGTVHAGDRQPGPDERSFPRCLLRPLGLVGLHRGARQDKPPALHGFARGQRRRLDGLAGG